MNYVLYCILIFSIIFQDLPLDNKLGFLGMSLTSLIVPFIFITLVILRTKFKVNKYSKILIKLYIYILFISLVSLSIYTLIYNGNLYFWNQNLFIKGIKTSVYFGEIILFLIVMENLQSKFTEEKIFKPFVFTYIILFFILIFELVFQNTFNVIFHGGEFYNRIRLTTSESSTTGTLFTVYFILSFYYFSKINKSKFFKLLMVTMYMLFVITNQSKGYFICLVISFIFIALKKLNFKKVRNIAMFLVSILIIFIMFNIMFEDIYNLFIKDLNEYTSFATRFYTTYCALLISIKYPFGIGTSLYPIALTNELINNLYIFSKFNLNLNLNEINEMIYSTTGYGVAAKIPVAQYGIYWGMVGTLVFIVSYWIKIYKTSNLIKNNYLLELGYLYCVFSILTYVSFENKFEIWALVGTIIFMENIKKKKLEI